VLEVEVREAQGLANVSARHERGRALLEVDLRRRGSDRQLLAIASDDPHVSLLEDAEERRDGVDGLEPRHPLACLLQARVEGWMSRDDKLGGLVVRPRVLLDEARDAHSFLGEDLADRGEDTWLVSHADAVIGARFHLTDRNHADAIVEAERRT